MIKYVLYNHEYAINYKEFEETKVGSYCCDDKYTNNTDPAILGEFDSKEEAFAELNKHENRYSLKREWGGMLCAYVDEYFIYSYEYKDGEDWKEDGEFRDIYTL